MRISSSPEPFQAISKKTTLPHSGSKSSVYLAPAAQGAPLWHSGLIIVAPVLHSRTLAKSLYQMCSTLAVWLDFNDHLQILIKLKIASAFSPDLASSQHPASIKPASSHHPASIQPASSRHQTSIQPASSQHPASIQPCITSSVTQASEPNR
jgi:hypothetical protein